MIHEIESYWDKIHFFIQISVSIKLACYNFTSLKNDMLMCSYRIQTMLQESSGNPRGWTYAFGQWYKSVIKVYRVNQVMNSSLFYYCSQKTKYSCNWCTFWQSKTRVFLLTSQMLALTATVLTVLKATTQDQCVLCVCYYLLMVIMMRKYAFNLETWNSLGGNSPHWPTSNHCDCIIFTPHACCPFAIIRLGNSSTRSRSTPYLAKFDLLSCPAGVWQVFTNCLGSVPFASV